MNVTFTLLDAPGATLPKLFQTIVSAAVLEGATLAETYCSTLESYVSVTLVGVSVVSPVLTTVTRKPVCWPTCTYWSPPVASTLASATPGCTMRTGAVERSSVSVSLATQLEALAGTGAPSMSVAPAVAVFTTVPVAAVALTSVSKSMVSV